MLQYFNKGERDVARMVEHSVVTVWIDPAWRMHLQFGLFSVPNLWSTTGPSKAMVCAVCGEVHIKDPLPLIGKSSLYGDTGFS